MDPTVDTSTQDGTQHSWDEFTLFPSLPLEIRLMIWSLSPQPRVVEVWLDDEKGFYSNVSTPAALSTNRESRSAVIGQYPLCFGSRFNFELDTLYFGREMTEHARLFFSSLRDLEITGLRNVAIDAEVKFYEDNYEVTYPTVRPICKTLESMPSLSTVMEVYDITFTDLSPQYWTCKNAGSMKLYDKIPVEVVEKMERLGMEPDAEVPDENEFFSSAYNLPSPEVLVGMRTRFKREVFKRGISASRG